MSEPITMPLLEATIKDCDDCGEEVWRLDKVFNSVVWDWFRLHKCPTVGLSK